MERIPFRTLYLHSLVRDAQGQKMSKMRGNVVDPLEWMEKHGTDALRFTLAIKAAPGTDIALSEDAVDGLPRLREQDLERGAIRICESGEIPIGHGNEHRGAGGAENSRGRAVSRRERSEPRGPLDFFAAGGDHRYSGRRARELSAFTKRRTWSTTSSGATSATGTSSGSSRRLRTRIETLPCRRGAICLQRCEAALRLLHPFMPFLTEELWHRLPQHAPEKDKNARSIALQPFPRPAPQWVDPDADQDVKLLQEVIVAARNIRAELKLDPKRRVAADFKAANPEIREVVEENRGLVLRLGDALGFAIFRGQARADGRAGAFVARNSNCRSRTARRWTLGAELARLRKEKERLARDLDSKQSRLADETFRSRAPAEVVRQLEATFAERQTEFAKLTERLAQLEKRADTSAGG